MDKRQNTNDSFECGLAVAQWVDPLGDPPTGGGPPCRPRAERVAASSTRFLCKSYNHGVLLSIALPTNAQFVR
jgi:hypothetical protein